MLCVKSLNDKLLFYFIMSGTAGLSAAKNRRSGNEVKFNGQSKSMPPPEQTSVSQVQQPMVRQQNMMPNPIEILKSHEFRLQQLEGENMEQDFLNHKVDFLTLKTDFLTLKNELLTNSKISKADVTSNSDIVCSTNKSSNSAEVSALHQRVGELMSIKQYIREKVEPNLTKMLHTAIASAPVSVQGPVQAQAQAPVQAPAILPLHEIHLSKPFIEPEIVTILDSSLEPILDNITLTIGC